MQLTIIMSFWFLIQQNMFTVSVISPERQLCHTLRPVVLTNKTGYLASVVSADTGCGTGDSPWLITLLPGQRINITLYDFTTQSDTAHVISANSTSAVSDVIGSGSAADTQTRLCRVYATVRETNGARAVTICGGQLRQRPAYVTLGHVAEIRLSTATTSIGDVTVTSHVTFLLKYEGLNSSRDLLRCRIICINLCVCNFQGAYWSETADHCLYTRSVFHHFSV